MCACVRATSQDETVTSLAYASRVKLITNNANKNQDSEEVARLKAIIKALKVRACVCVRGHWGVCTPRVIPIHTTWGLKHRGPNTATLEARNCNVPCRPGRAGCLGVGGGANGGGWGRRTSAGTSTSHAQCYTAFTLVIDH
jgi:hypothetical protein